MAVPDEIPQNGKITGERIAKVIARSGLCSRRDAEALIEERRVSVNGSIIDSAALDVLPKDEVFVDGRVLPLREPPRLWRYYKPKGRVTTHKDPEGRPTVFESLPEDLPRMISVGRLDYNTEGLLLLTNDGDLARHLELPSTGWSRRYRVRAYGKVDQGKLNELAGGLTVNKVNYGPIEATIEREQGDNVWITLSIREGKNREVRRIMEHLGLTVNRLIRISFGPFILGDLETGQIEEVKTSVLKDQLGPRLSRQLGVRREPLREEKKLAPARSKPTYLRRKPGTPPRPERLDEDRPVRHRRILQIDGTEAAKIEAVPEKKSAFGRFGRGGPGADRPRRHDFDAERPPRRDEPRGDREGRERDRASGPSYLSRASTTEGESRSKPQGDERGSSWRGSSPRTGETDRDRRPSSRGGEDDHRGHRTKRNSDRSEDRPSSSFRSRTANSSSERTDRKPFKGRDTSGDARGTGNGRSPQARPSFHAKRDHGEGGKRFSRDGRPAGNDARDARPSRERPPFREGSGRSSEQGRDRNSFARPERSGDAARTERRPTGDRSAFRGGSDRAPSQRDDRKPFNRRPGDENRTSSDRAGPSGRPPFRGGDRTQEQRAERPSARRDGGAPGRKQSPSGADERRPQRGGGFKTRDASESRGGPDLHNPRQRAGFRGATGPRQQRRGETSAPGDGRESSAGRPRSGGKSGKPFKRREGPASRPASRENSGRRPDKDKP